ncbi:RagB/SusD family nutrient uptake outer membrane protein [Sphingobacterium chuzhouense]|uniref:RagB/SusD family nutrient uptake outer membrane protein n=1 Tax=Sphingobacterium chuzhouense TaxID=1742264 RepID=A0ABR7XPV5_9SPHI|nr:RagB/SusD family nutrient uptake outer membrane protein [Sphingobacterium chuzhouense]MBD1421205.1 RagB/SusD family nutrient uptake outer membrane protein [Sphingobacterium chuzhouense]
MKKILFFTLITFSISSCTDYLEVKTYGKAIPKTSEEFSALLHTHLNDIDYGADHVLIENASALVSMESITDNFSVALTMPAGTVLPKYIGDMLGGNSGSNKQRRYELLYAVVRDANIIINNMPSVEHTDEQNVMGTAYAMRAIAYYHLLREFCEPYESDEQLGLPIVRDFDMEERPLRSNYGMTRTFIEDDFKSALSFAVSDEIYRYTEDVVKAYQTRFYFWTKQWDKAAPLAKEIVSDYPLAEGQAYTTMIQARNEKTGNVLFRSYLFPGNQDQAFTDAQRVIKTRPLTKEFVDLFEERNRDIRHALYFDNKRLTQKMLSGKVRSAEFQLVLAECYAHLGQHDLALEAVNTLRSMRIANYVDYSLETLPAVDLSALIKVDAEGKLLTPLMQLILRERRKELFAEGDRFFELKRNGRPTFWAASNGLKYTTEEYMYTFPLPRIDVELIPGLIQNEGYQF